MATTKKRHNLNKATLFGIFCASLVFSTGFAYAYFTSNTVVIAGVSMTTAGNNNPPAPPLVRLFAVADNEFNQEDPQDNFGSDKDADITSNDNENTRLALRFDLTALPNNATINSCSLNIFMNDAPAFNSRQYGAYRLIDHEDTWGEGEGNGDTAQTGESSWQWFAKNGHWSLPGGDIALLPTATINSGTDDRVWQSWDVSSDCDQIANRSWIIKDESENQDRKADAEFETKESNDFSRRPYLAIDFTGGTASTDHLVINEVLIDTDDHGHDRDNEWIELYNPTSSTINLTGWQICEAEGCSTLPSATISPLDFALLTPKATTQSFWPGSGSNWINLGERFGDDSLDNDGDRVILRNQSGNIIDQLSYEEDTTIFNPSIPGASSDSSLNRVVNGHDTDRILDFWVNPQPTPGR